MGIVWLGDAACHERDRVGGKTAYLSRLAARYRVPPGFCLTVDPESGEQVGEQAIAEAYAALAARTGCAAPAVAVRSSALDEDGALTSFAGQHETYLNVVGVAALLEAVRRCRESAEAPRALAYRRAQGLALDDLGARVAVLVQQLVVADTAAVAFSANPVSGEQGEIVITASWGLGESIVGGTVTPDTFRLRKDDLCPLDRVIADKARMTVAVPGGTREVAVPKMLRRQPTLSDEQAGEIGHLARSLEAECGWPVDVECAHAGGCLYLLQCRPITTLFAAPFWAEEPAGTGDGAAPPLPAPALAEVPIALRA